jgi:hypothetical protein
MFGKNPVAWLTTVVAVLTALDATLGGLGVLPGTAAAWIGGAIAVLTAVLGVLTHGAVTPVASPRDNSGRPLVPVSSATPAGPLAP